MIEFRSPSRRSPHPTTGQPILYYGRHDMVGQRVDSGQLMVEIDEKTTEHFGPFGREWNQTSSFTGCHLVDQQSNIDVTLH